MHLFWQALSSGPYWRGALTALELTAASLSAALGIGFFVALGSLSEKRWVRIIAWFSDLQGAGSRPSWRRGSRCR
jgi:ABC-type amino acid transport system permease subunit